ncbi:MAG TPA: hypothetical protein VKU01_17625 [Bryobacteraceae bacterium]|nr:hypothetical protein [Bryobacteraceae bacterium]
MKKVQKLAVVLFLALVVALLSMPAQAQTLGALSIERVLSLANIHTLVTPNIPPDILAALASGALEAHERIIYNPQANTLTITDFLLPAKSPLPTPASQDLTAATIQVTVISVDKVYVTSKPIGSVMINGTISAYAGNLYGTALGLPASISFGYTTDNPPKINTVVGVVGGLVTVYSDAAVGTATIVTPPPPPPPPGGGSAPTVVITPASQTTVAKTVHLDASQSTDPNNLALTYQWSVSAGFPSASILSPTSAMTDVQLSGAGGTYMFQVVVTNSAGASTTGTTTVIYLGRGH